MLHCNRRKGKDIDWKWNSLNHTLLQMQSGQDGLAASKRLNDGGHTEPFCAQGPCAKGGKISFTFRRMTQTGKHIVLVTATHLHEVQKQSVKMHLHNRAVWLWNRDFSAVGLEQISLAAKLSRSQVGVQHHETDELQSKTLFCSQKMSVNLLAGYQTRHTIDKEHKVSEEEPCSFENGGVYVLEGNFRSEYLSE